MYILADIGGTKIRLTASKDLKAFAVPIVKATPANFEEALTLITRTANDLCGDEKVEAFCAGLPGEFKKDHDALGSSPNLPEWIGVPIVSKLKHALKAPVYIKNDAALVGLGEALFGAGKGYGIVAYITVSTGVGGAKIVHGVIDESVVGFEPGHQIIDMDNTVCPDCEAPATLEHYVGGASLKKRYHVEPYEVRDPKVWEELSGWLAKGLYNTVLHWSPDVVVLGGSMIVGDPAIPVDRVKTHLYELNNIFPEMPEVVPATLKDFGGLYGAMVYLKQALGKS